MNKKRHVKPLFYPEPVLHCSLTFLKKNCFLYRAWASSFLYLALNGKCLFIQGLSSIFKILFNTTINVYLETWVPGIFININNYFEKQVNFTPEQPSYTSSEGLKFQLKILFNTTINVHIKI